MNRHKETPMRTLTVHKDGHAYVFRYAEGRECDMLEAVAELAARPDNGFDWADAATISFQVTADQAASCLRAMGQARSA